MNKSLSLLVAACGLAMPAFAQDVKVTVIVENLSPQNGTFATPLWFGFHDGTFDIFDAGSAASIELERLAEDGMTDPLDALFKAANPAFQSGVIMGPLAEPGPIDPGETAMISLTLDSSNPAHRFFSFASMLIPSNDGFVANDDPQAWQAFDGMGNFQPFSFVILGSQIWDAGTEVNTEIPEHTAFFGQVDPDTGIPEGGVVGIHPGYLGSVDNPGEKMILADPMFANADFKVPGYEYLRITVVPAPGAAAALATLALAGLRRRR